MCIDQNFKVSLTALRIIGLLTHQYAEWIAPHFNHVSESLVRKLEDNKIVIWHSILKIFYSLSKQMTNTQPITDLALKYLEHPKWHVREECLSLLTMHALTQGSISLLSDPWNIIQISKRLKDEKAKVRSNAIDLFCVIVQNNPSHVDEIQNVVGVDLAYRI